jgi:hypothetical protein
VEIHINTRRKIRTVRAAVYNVNLGMPVVSSTDEDGLEFIHSIHPADNTDLRACRRI